MFETLTTKQIDCELKTELKKQIYDSISKLNLLEISRVLNAHSFKK